MNFLHGGLTPLASSHQFMFQKAQHCNIDTKLLKHYRIERALSERLYRVKRTLLRSGITSIL